MVVQFWIGAIRGYNDKSLGVCLIEEKNLLKSIFFFKIGYQRLEKKYPNAKIVGHYEITNSSKTSYFNVKKWCKKMNFNSKIIVFHCFIYKTKLSVMKQRLSLVKLL